MTASPRKTLKHIPTGTKFQVLTRQVKSAKHSMKTETECNHKWQKRIWWTNLTWRSHTHRLKMSTLRSTRYRMTTVKLCFINALLSQMSTKMERNQIATKEKLPWPQRTQLLHQTEVLKSRRNWKVQSSKCNINCWSIMEASRKVLRKLIRSSSKYLLIKGLQCTQLTLLFLHPLAWGLTQISRCMKEGKLHCNYSQGKLIWVLPRSLMEKRLLLNFRT
jgi:hypothetical protein